MLFRASPWPWLLLERVSWAWDPAWTLLPRPCKDGCTAGWGALKTTVEAGPPQSTLGSDGPLHTLTSPRCKCFHTHVLPPSRVPLSFLRPLPSPASPDPTCPGLGVLPRWPASPSDSAQLAPPWAGLQSDSSRDPSCVAS